MMAHASVSNSVLSIVGSFASGSDVLKKVRERRRRARRWRRNGDTAAEEQEQRLFKSLRQGPEEIAREYQRNLLAVGDAYAVGDAFAQNTLAELLYRMNTGLIGIIASFLQHRDKRGVTLHLDYRRLIDLSEQTRMDTCQALYQLHKRLTSRSRVPEITTARRKARDGGKSSRKGSSTSSSEVHSSTSSTTIKGPMIARVVIEDSSKPARMALVKPGEKRRKTGRNTSISSSASKSSLSLASPPSSALSSSSTSSTPLPSPPPAYVAMMPTALSQPTVLPVNHHPTRQNRPPPGRAGPTQPSDPRATRSTPVLDTIVPLPVVSNVPAPTFIPALPHRPVPRRRGYAPPSYYSIAASDRTKLGEIPLESWSEPWNFERMDALNREAARDGWPMMPRDGNAVGQGRKRVGLWSRLLVRR